MHLNSSNVECEEPRLRTYHTFTRDESTLIAKCIKCSIRINIDTSFINDLGVFGTTGFLDQALPLLKSVISYDDTPKIKANHE